MPAFGCQAFAAAGLRFSGGVLSVVGLQAQESIPERVALLEVDAA
ncbi:hypothetical protein [Frondihabitans sucicola]|nr:hypothetical protein [Frondihabitans sucicola]